MRKYAIILSMLFVFIGHSNAQKSDSKAVNLLNEVAEEIKNYHGFHIEFTFGIDNLRDSTKQFYNGEIWFKDKAYKLDMMGSVIHSDGKTTNWVYQEETGEINITPYNEEETSTFINPYRFLENFETEYTCRFISDKFVNNRPLVELHLFPNDIEASNYSRIKIKIDKAKKELYEFTFVGNEGVNYIITVNKLHTDKAVTTDMVKFNKEYYPDAEIIDMR
ncbi:MAG: hypothetical protein U9Q98_01120 [Bacteroidota bacterium]|nr:hypothetical protein [Bacteroidota bacterium]